MEALLHPILCVLYRIEEILRILYNRTVRFEFDSDRSTIDIVRVGATVCRTLGEHCVLAVAFMVTDDFLKSFTFIGKLTPKSLQG